MEGISQLVKPKGNKRQGFRGDDAYGGGTTAGGQRSGGERGDGPATGAQFGSDRMATEKMDFFDQSYVQGPFGFDGYRDTVVPNTTEYGNKSRLGSLVASGIGALAGIPGLGVLTSLTGPFDNRAFYDTKVVPAGKFTGDSYEDYMSQRAAGIIDAYGNRISPSDNRQPINNLMRLDGILGLEEVAPIIEDQEPIETPMTDLERYQSYLSNFFGGR
jgi:hypothetical protein